MQRLHLAICQKCDKFKKIPKALKKVLDRAAYERITDMMSVGDISGEWSGNFYIDVPNHKTPEDGWEFDGGFEILKNNP